LTRFTDTSSGSRRKAAWKWSTIGAFCNVFEGRLMRWVGLLWKSGAQCFRRRGSFLGKGGKESKNGRRAAGANCLSRHHSVATTHVYDLNCCGCSTSLCLVSSLLPHKSSVSASSSSLRLVKQTRQRRQSRTSNETIKTGEKRQSPANF
jgi:hypothetical protein